MVSCESSISTPQKKQDVYPQQYWLDSTRAAGKRVRYDLTRCIRDQFQQNGDGFICILMKNGFIIRSDAGLTLGKWRWHLMFNINCIQLLSNGHPHVQLCFCDFCLQYTNIFFCPCFSLSNMVNYPKNEALGFSLRNWGLPHLAAPQ